MTDRQKILIVDDQAANLHALRQVLAELDVEIIEATSGNQALAATLQHDFALAILDVMMPAMDGYELAQYLRGDTKTRNLPIIFLTAVYAEEERIFKGYEVGAVDYIVKPYNPVLLLSKVRVFLELETARAQLSEKVAALTASEQKLRKMHDELELRVRERTSELQSSNRALSEHATKLERLNQELQDFAFVASHDLQEPLRKIQTFCDMIKKRCAPALDGTGREYLDRVVNSADRMRRLLRDLLEFSDSAAKPRELKKIKLEKSARDAAELFEEDLKVLGGLVEIQDLPDVQADENQMLRLFQNLIGNALKFRSEQSPRIRIYARNNGGGHEILVKDNGIGFDPHYAERIFKPFQKLHGGKKYDGTGIGLAICRKIVERHGGSISAESEPGKGSTFIIKLPAKQGGKIL